MSTFTLHVASDGSLVIPHDIADQFGLTPNQTVIVEKRNSVIFVLPESAIDQILDELDGCLGEESSASYDFDLKIGGLHEAR